MHHTVIQYRVHNCVASHMMNPIAQPYWIHKLVGRMGVKLSKKAKM